MFANCGRAQYNGLRMRKAMGHACGMRKAMEAEIALSTSFLRKYLSVCAVRGQSQALLGRLDVIGPGAAAAAQTLGQRRNNALLLESDWA